MGFISSAKTDAGSPRLHFTVCSARAALENEKGGLKKPPFEEFRDGPKRLLVHRNRRSIAACTKKHQNSQIHVCREKVSRRISQNNVRSAGMECIDFTLIGAIDRATWSGQVTGIQCCCTSDCARHRNGRTIDRNVVSRVCPRTVHVARCGSWRKATGCIVLEHHIHFITGRPSCRFRDHDCVA